MESENKIKYRELCRQKSDLPIFYNDWWLDAVCGEQNWNACISESNGNVNGILPYFCQKKLFFFNFIKMPLLTHYLGPWLFYPKDQKYSSKIGFENETIEYLYNGLPKFTFLRNRFSHVYTNWLALYWKGYKQTTKYTYILDITDLKKVHEDFKSNIRGKIKKAAGIVKVEEINDAGTFYRLMNKTFERQKMKNPVKLELLERIENVLKNRNCRKIFVAKDEAGNIHSAAYVFWDKEYCYLSMVGEDPDLRQSGAGILLVWEIISYASKELKITHFDFLGSMLPGVEPVRRAFGAVQTPYFEITKVRLFGK